jgi:nucleotide-binding universal stress UspA family protein
MAIRTLLVHLDNSAHCAARLHLASALARRHQAHLIGAATSGLSRFLYPSLPPEQNDPTLALHLSMLREQANGALDRFLRHCASDAPPSHAACLVNDEAGAGIALHARAADLVIMSQDAVGALPADLAAYVVLHAGRPVLLLPAIAGLPSAGHDVLVAWDASREAARALQLSLPLLHTARSVRVALITRAPPTRDSLDALAIDPLTYLQRHGVQATMLRHTLAGGGRVHQRHAIGDALLSLAADQACDLLVMGAYGHSRMRETILGGVTRTVLESMTIPVLMVH